jgi:ribonuclease Y
MSLFSLFTKTITKKKTEKTPSPKVKTVKKTVDPEVLEMVKIAEEKAKNILIEAKEDAKHLEKMTEEELAELRQQYTEIKSELDKKQRGLTIQESIVAKKEHSVKKLTDLITETQKNIHSVEEDLVKNLVKKSSLEQKEAEQLIMDKFMKDLETNTQKDLQFQEEILSEKSELIAQDILLQVMKHGATSYSSEYVPPIITFETPNEEQRILGKDQENLRFIESLSTVEITFDEEQHQLKLYCFNTIQREIVRVLLERLKKGGQVNQQKIKTLYDQTKRDLDRDMFEAGRYLCNQLRVYNLPREIIQTLGMFKYRYSYGQNMIVHTLEEAKIGIALAHELGANTDVVRLGCLFHDIGKVIYEDTNHVEAGVKFLDKFNMQNPTKIFLLVLLNR